VKLILYNNQSASNVINKNLTQVAEKNILLKASTSIYQPNLLFKYDNGINWSLVNYAKLFNRYYFVKTETQRNNSLILLILKEDVLETYKDNILNSEVDIIEKSKPSNVSQNDVQADTINKTYKSDTTLNDDKTIIAVTNGSNFWDTQKTDTNNTESSDL